MPLIAEDLGLITPEVNALLQATDLPGMRVFQFGFGTQEDDYHRPEQYPPHSVAYTGTHDNDTLLGWQADYLREPPVDVLTPYMEAWGQLHPELRHRPFHWQCIAAVMASASNTAIFPVQDILGLYASARMNVPGLAQGNWTWRLRDDQLTDTVGSELRAVTAQTGRL